MHPIPHSHPQRRRGRRAGDAARVGVVAAIVPLAWASCALLFDPGNLRGIDAGRRGPDAAVDAGSGGRSADAGASHAPDAGRPGPPDAGRPPCRGEGGANECTRCGDGVCNGGETTRSCPDDCGTRCGDGVCNGGETPCNCKKDCRDACGHKDCCKRHGQLEGRRRDKQRRGAAPAITAA